MTTTPTLKKAFTFQSAFMFSFVFVSPIVALYGVFALVLGAAGPSGWWSFLIVFAGQIIVAFVFAELASRWPIEGSLYQWARRLVGNHYGWFTGWIYMWTLAIACAGGSFITSQFLPLVLGLEPFDLFTQILVALGTLAVIMVLNLIGPKAIKAVVFLAIMAEVVGSVALAITLFLFFQEQPFSVLLQGADVTVPGVTFAGIAAAAAFVGWGFVGFESAGDIAEEVEDPRRNVPKAIIAAILSVGTVVVVSALALIIAIPDLGRVLSGEEIDPAAYIVGSALGEQAVVLLFLLIIVGFVACMLATQMASSRVMWAFARDNAFPASRWIKRLSPRTSNPNSAIVVTAILTMLILVAATTGPVYATLVSFSTAGFFISFALPVVAHALTRHKSSWTPGPFSLGKAGKVLVPLAAVWVVLELINIAWPRTPELDWWQNYSVVIGLAGVLSLGLIVWFPRRSTIANLPIIEPGSEDDHAAETAESAATSNIF
ncbi:putative amino acid transporter [Arthrobacter globiformis NBRC 12137]|uniref:Putative amino acid transporter n=1 Tax=Arthrobacter globiformis (strain ATCC 8010 / DSM 20124 / JCM 1332 / NBRC 12137 / NCIMB 8907 / NRRL B-2979 / 168) TaxID=1077972 RepID=H0QK02_ARTG1|nr:amino acid permease [Arthrobacter globiformis]GAB13242.1 putative amino acid transporter [Arthrobacter globiformis NBRC 12137]